VAIPKALQQAGLTKDEIDVFELNEAFASQAAYCVRELKLDPERVNPLGGACPPDAPWHCVHAAASPCMVSLVATLAPPGAIALGHPLGCTGARQIATLLPELERRNGKYGVISMCIGTGASTEGRAGGHCAHDNVAAVSACSVKLRHRHGRRRGDPARVARPGVPCLRRVSFWLLLRATSL